jgi:dolichol-phosphate mannosyltransferase
MKMQKLFVIVPVYNEEPNIPTLFDAFGSLQQEFVERFNVYFILVDDGSQDKTVEVARTLGNGLRLEVLAHGVNKGPGAAFATAFSSLASRLGEADWVITMEGDNTSRHELIRQMLKRTEEGFDVVLASPYMYGGGFTQTSFLRKLLSSGANLLVKDLLAIQGILTVSSFFRLCRGKTILHMQRVFGIGIVERLGFECMVEMVMKMTMLRIPISEVAMQLDSSRRQGKSKMGIWRTIRGYLTLWVLKSEWQSLAAKEIKK